MADKAKDLGDAGRSILGGATVRKDGTVGRDTNKGGAYGGRTTAGRVKVASYVVPEDYAALERIHERDERSISWLVARAIREYVERHG